MKFSRIILPVAVRGRDYVPVRSGQIDCGSPVDFTYAGEPSFAIAPPLKGCFAISSGTFRRLKGFKRESLKFLIKDDGYTYEFKARITDWKPIQRFFARWDEQGNKKAIITGQVVWIDGEIERDIVNTWATA